MKAQSVSSFECSHLFHYSTAILIANEHREMNMYDINEIIARDMEFRSEIMKYLNPIIKHTWQTISLLSFMNRVIKSHVLPIRTAEQYKNRHHQYREQKPSRGLIRVDLFPSRAILQTIKTFVCTARLPCAHI